MGSGPAGPIILEYYVPAVRHAKDSSPKHDLGPPPQPSKWRLLAKPKALIYFQRGAVIEWLRIGQKQRLVMNRTHRCDWYEYIFDF